MEAAKNGMVDGIVVVLRVRGHHDGVSVGESGRVRAVE